MKLAGILLLLLTSSAVGFLEAHKLSLRVDQLEKFLRFVTQVQAEIQFTSLPVARLVEKHRDEMKLLALCHQYSREQEFPIAWEKAVEAGTRGLGLKKKEVQLLRDFGSALGCTDLAGQMAHCRLTAQQTELCLEAARQDKGKKAKLYAMLGIFFGAATALVIG